MTEREAARPPAAPATAQPKIHRSTGQRLSRAFFAAEFLLAMVVRVFIGVLVFVLPWTPFWDSNHLLQEFPRLAHFLSYGAMRGIVSGIGLLNLWVAVDETLHRNQRHL